jgi:hypothetical protein
MYYICTNITRVKCTWKLTIISIDIFTYIYCTIKQFYMILN